MTNKEFDALIDAEEKCSDELYSARVKLFEAGQLDATLWNIISYCEFGYVHAKKCSFDEAEFFERVSDDATAMVKRLADLRKSLVLKIKTLEEQS